MPRPHRQPMARSSGRGNLAAIAGQQKSPAEAGQGTILEGKRQ
jgi:hypothetical protein